MKRHVKENHRESSSVNAERSKKYLCPEIGCGKAFKHPSKLHKHEDSHSKLFSFRNFSLSKLNSG